jgi:DNA-binding transcriptional MerR regulator
MKKAPEAFRTISEVAELLDTPAHMLRFWESKFYQIRPVKRAGGRRYYRPDDVALINGIRILLQDRNQTLRGVQRLLQEKGLRHVIEIGAKLPEPPPGARPPEAADEAGDEGGHEGGEAAAVAPAAPPSPAREGARPQAAAIAEVRPLPAPRPPAPVPVPPRTPAPAPAATTPPVEDEPPLPPESHLPRLPQLLREVPRDGLGARRDRVAGLARRIDALLDRMSDASGAGRW